MSLSFAKARKNRPTAARFGRLVVWYLVGALLPFPASMSRALLLASLLPCARAAVDVVVAHHDEDLAWLSSVTPPSGAAAPRVLVYTKGEDAVRLPGNMKMTGEGLVE